MSNELDMYYGNYLKIPTLLSLQCPESAKAGTEAHDETLFIIVHQVYELWFKQIIHELNSIRTIFSEEQIREEILFTVAQRMRRVSSIQNLLNEQIAVIETMTPMDFLEFRDLLMPASGFQSVQFRKIEMIMGLSQTQPGGDQYFLARLSSQDQKDLEEERKYASLLELLEKWLEKTPFLIEKEFHFCSEYRQKVEDMLGRDRLSIEGNPHFDEEQRQAQLKNLLDTAKTFESLFDADLYEEQKAQGKRYLSQSAMQGALFISLYREQPLLAMPYQVLHSLVDFDERLSLWRYRHALMAHRMLGTKIGTGGSSGHHYLKRAADQNRVFTDLFDLASFLISKSELPRLSQEMRKNLNFYLPS